MVLVEVEPFQSLIKRSSLILKWILLLVLWAFARDAFAQPLDPNIGDLRLNEILFNPGDITPATGQNCDGMAPVGQETADDEYVEFFNAGANSIDLSGYCLSRNIMAGNEAGTGNDVWLIPAGTTVAPGGFVTFCGGLSFGSVDMNGDFIMSFNNTPGVNANISLYQPTTANNCKTAGAGNDASSVEIAVDYNPVAEANGQPYMFCDTGGGAQLDYHTDTNGAFMLPSPGAENCTASLPVTLASFSTQKNGANLKFIWSTSSETFNFGFNLWGEINGEWHKLNKAVVPSHGADSLTTQRYQENVLLTELPGSITAAGISSVELNGHEQFFGPYEVGQSYGGDPSLDTIAWQSITAEVGEKMIAQGYKPSGRHWVKPRSAVSRKASGLSTNAVLSGNNVLAEFRSEHKGMHRVTHADLLAANVDLAGVAINQLALTLNGQPLPRFINAQNGLWTSASYVDFYSAGASGELLLHTSELVYRLERDATTLSMLPADELDREIQHPASVHTAQTARNEQNVYDFVMPKPDPWYEKALHLNPFNEGYPSTIHAFTLDVRNAAADTIATVNARVIALTDFIPGIDHRVQLVHVNASGQEHVLATGESDGYGEISLSGSLSAAELAASNQFRIKQKLIEADAATGQLPNGWLGSYVYFDSADISYTTTNDTQNDISYWSQAIENNALDGFTISGLSQSNAVAYAQASDSLIRLAPKNATQDTASGNWSVNVEKAFLEDAETIYWVSTPGALNSAAVAVPDLTNAALDTGNSDYVIIAHPAFINRLENPDSVNGEADFIANKQSHGHNVSLVDYEQVAQVYGFGHRTPQAITAYLKAEKLLNPSLKYVLLVGSASRDANDYTGAGSWNMIPTYYDTTHSFLHYAPNDGRIADLDEDGFQDLAIGRWPVRTQADLNTLIEKTIKYTDGTATTPATQSLNTAVLAADIADSVYDFGIQMDTVNNQLVQAGFSTLKVYKDDGGEAQNLIDAINAGQSITSYSGHAGPAQWSYSSMLHYGQVSELTNIDHPTLTLPLSCYTTYTVSEHTNTLGQKLLSHSGGSVAIMGTSSLSGYGENQAIISDIMRSMTTGVDVDGDNKPDVTLSLGEAVMRAKQTMTAASSAANISGNLIGDPSLRISAQNSTSNTSVRALRAY